MVPKRERDHVAKRIALDGLLGRLRLAQRCRGPCDPAAEPAAHAEPVHGLDDAPGEELSLDALDALGVQSRHQRDVDATFTDPDRKARRDESVLLDGAIGVDPRPLDEPRIPQAMQLALRVPFRHPETGRERARVRRTPRQLAKDATVGRIAEQAYEVARGGRSAHPRG